MKKKCLKLTILCLIIGGFLGFSSSIVFAQQYQTYTKPVTTQVGNPANTNAPGPTGNMLDWDRKINAALERGVVWNYYNRMMANISNNGYTAVTRTGNQKNTSSDGLYWCTNSIIDSYNLAGRSGLGLDQQAVISMQHFWASTPGYTYVEYQQANHQAALSKVSVGYAIFFENQRDVFTGYEHVAMISTININSSGDGYIETLDSNGPAKSSRYPVVQWDIQNPPYPVIGFGG